MVCTSTGCRYRQLDDNKLTSKTGPVGQSRKSIHSLCSSPSDGGTSRWTLGVRRSLWWGRPPILRRPERLQARAATRLVQASPVQALLSTSSGDEHPSTLHRPRSTRRDMGSIIRVFPALGVRREFAASSRRWRTCTPVDVLQANDIVLVELAEGDLEDPYSRLPDNTKTVGSPAGYENPLPRFRPEDPIT
jgi:hypothetical protein